MQTLTVLLFIASTCYSIVLFSYTLNLLRKKREIEDLIKTIEEAFDGDLIDPHLKDLQIKKIYGYWINERLEAKRLSSILYKTRAENRELQNLIDGLVASASSDKKNGFSISGIIMQTPDLKQAHNIPGPVLKLFPTPDSTLGI